MFPGKERPSIRLCGRALSRAGAWFGGSTLTAMGREIWVVTEESIAPSSCIRFDSYRFWEKELGRNDFIWGQFGENFTVDGLADDEVCIGDRYRIGSALFEVTQPRVTCYRVGIRMNEPRMAALLVAHHRPGFYFRVLEEGEVGSGDETPKSERPRCA